MSKLEIARDIEQAFVRAGVRRTPQRFFVLERLITSPDHATVEELWAALNKRHARASRATVYNTLHALVRAGLVREFTLDGKAARYDANLAPHHHFVCDRCGAVEDIPWFDIGPFDIERFDIGRFGVRQPGIGSDGGVPALNRSRSGSRRIRCYEVILRGDCAKCHSNN